MRHWLALVLVVGVGALMFGFAGCGGVGSPWFGSDLDAALSEARERDTLVMIDFKTSWCTWCKRLDQDTFSDSEVIAELEELVAIRLDAEEEGKDAAEKYGVRSFPTVVFLDAAGREVDRILGYLPPDAFLIEIRRIRTGDTFNACLASLDEDPANLDALERAVEGLLERSDAAAAMTRVEAFHSVHGDDENARHACRLLMFAARSAMNENFYRSVARLYRRDWPELPEVPDSLGVVHLHTVIAGLETIENDREALRSARLADAQDLLETLDIEKLDPGRLLEAAAFAFRAGQYDSATEFYRRWFDARDIGAQVERLNGVAWNLYLMGRERPAAIAMAQEAYDVDRDAGIGDTLARLLYVDGKIDEAIEIENRAAEDSDGRTAEEFAAAVEKMRNGQDLGDHPHFDEFPGEKQG